MIFGGTKWSEEGREGGRERGAWRGVWIVMEGRAFRGRRGCRAEGAGKKKRSLLWVVVLVIGWVGGWLGGLVGF